MRLQVTDVHTSLHDQFQNLYPAAFPVIFTLGQNTFLKTISKDEFVS